MGAVALAGAGVLTGAESWGKVRRRRSLAGLMCLKALQQSGSRLSARASDRTGGGYQGGYKMHTFAWRDREPG